LAKLFQFEFCLRIGLGGPQTNLGALVFERKFGLDAPYQEQLEHLKKVFTFCRLLENVRRQVAGRPGIA
jgi:hypothetical protein